MVDGSIAVVGFLVEVGARSNPFLSKVLRQVKAIEKEGSETAIRGLQFGIIAKSLARNTVYRYQGSLTTPPCTEGLEVSQFHFSFFRLTFRNLHFEHKLTGLNLVDCKLGEACS